MEMPGEAGGQLAVGRFGAPREPIIVREIEWDILFKKNAVFGFFAIQNNTDALIFGTLFDRYTRQRSRFPIEAMMQEWDGEVSICNRRLRTWSGQANPIGPVKRGPDSERRTKLTRSEEAVLHRFNLIVTPE